MSRRDKIRMTDEEVAAFLEEGRTLQVATIGGDGAPHLVAMWYMVLDGELAFWTYGKSQKVIDLERDPRITCLVEAGETYDQLRGVQVRGRGEVVSDHDTVMRVGEGVYERYTGPVDDNARAFVATAGAKRVAIVVRPDRIVSWDHRKLGGTY
jgi:PPOX class probable F420-dependent enzyme